MPRRMLKHLAVGGKSTMQVQSWYWHKCHAMNPAAVHTPPPETANSSTVSSWFVLLPDGRCNTNARLTKCGVLVTSDTSVLAAC